MLPRGHRQESLAKAYVRAIAAYAGVICSEPDLDYGIDLCLRAVRLRGKRFADSSGQIDVQLKTTSQAIVHEDTISIDLGAKNYADLIEAGENCPRLLVVLIQPSDEGEWLGQSEEQMAVRRCAYWISLEGHPRKAASSSVRISIPRANVFSVEAVHRLFTLKGAGR